jgi:hypothetical protein
MQSSFPMIDEMDGSLKHLVAPCCDTLNGWLREDVGDNADALGGSVIGIEDSEAADHGGEPAWQREGRNMVVSSGG